MGLYEFRNFSRLKIYIYVDYPRYMRSITVSYRDSIRAILGALYTRTLPEFAPNLSATVMRLIPGITRFIHVSRYPTLLGAYITTGSIRSYSGKHSVRTLSAINLWRHCSARSLSLTLCRLFPSRSFFFVIFPLVVKI